MMEGMEWNSAREGIVALLVMWAPRVIGAVALLVFGLMGARIVRSAAGKWLYRSQLDDTLVPFVRSLIYYALVAFIIVAVLGMFGIQTASLVAVLGAAAFAVGLAMQGTLSNFAAGVMLLIFRPFRVGDFIDAAGNAGSVVEIGIFHTSLNTGDNVRIIVSNSQVYSSTIKNYATNDNRRVDMVVGIGYGDDIGRALEVIGNAVSRDERVLEDPETKIAVHELGDSSVNIVVRPWCRRQDYWAVKWDLTRRFKEDLEAAGLSIPFPQRDVHLFEAARTPA